MKRFAIGIASVALAALAFAASVGFGVNGDQYQWWRIGFLVIALESLLGGLVLATRSHAGLRLGPIRLAVALVGLVVLGASVLKTTSRYCDSCGGGLFWPHVLACVGVAGFTLAAGAIVSGAMQR